MIQIHPKVEQMGGVKWDIGMTHEATRAAKVHQEAMNKSFRLPRELKEDAEVSESRAIHIFNVGPFSERVFLGGWGDVRIPVCPAGQPWVYVCKVPGIYVDMIPGEGKYEAERVSGSYVAQEILGEGPDLRNYRGGDSRRKIGVFIGSVKGPNGATPLVEEVEAAKAEVAQYLHELVLEANGAWGTGNENEFKSTVSSKHYLAASLTQQTDVPWFKAKLAPKKETMVTCPACGGQKRDFPVCAGKEGCGYKDPNHPKYEALFGAPKAEAPAGPSAAELELARLKEENDKLKAPKVKG